VAFQGLHGKEILAGVTALLMSTAASAQVGGLNSASLPPRTEVSKAPPDSQVHSTPQDRARFRSKREPYEQGKHHRPRVRPQAGPFYGYAYYEETYVRREELQPPLEPPRPVPERRVVDEEPKAVFPPRAPGPPRTFYVIPGCYAGDRRPVAEQLPAGCDIARLRIVPPRT
jgi:hypothetical protein